MLYLRNEFVAARGLIGALPGLCVLTFIMIPLPSRCDYN